MKRLWPVLFLAMLPLLGGCAGYRLGGGSEPRFGRLFIAPAGSDILLPQATAVVTTQVREAFLKDGRVGLADSADQADAVLTLRLASYGRETAVVRTDDTGLARRFDVTLRVRATLTDRKTGGTIFADRVLSVQRGVFTDGGQLQSEYQALPILAEELARQAVHATLDTW